MKLRDLLGCEYDSKQEYRFIDGHFVIVGDYSWKKRFDSEKDADNVLNKYLDCEIFEIEASDIFTEIGHYALVIYINDSYLAKKEREEKRKEMQK